MIGKLNSELPKIGIRPIIDGRRNGVRESLEEQTMSMAIAVAEFLTKELKYPNGEEVQCVIADTTIGGVAEASRCADKFRKENVGVSLSVTPCWCYGAETIDMDPFIPKAIWGFNGTERPGAVYLAAAMAAHDQKGIPAFKIYGRDVIDATNKEIPEDVKSKILMFVKAGLAVSMMKGKSYLSMGSVSMGIAGSIVDTDFFQDYLGMRNESIDMTEIVRRIDEEIYDKVEFEKALAWTKEKCIEGVDTNKPHLVKTREEKDKDWENVVKMAIIAKDLMAGNDRLKELGFIEEGEGHNAILSGFQGQRHWTDHFTNGDYLEAILNSNFDWNGKREPYLVATENDSLNGVAMLFGHLLTNTPQIFADVRTYWSPTAIERVTGWKPEGMASNGLIHLINSGAASLDGTGQEEIDGKPVIKPFWEVTDEEVEKCLKNTLWRPANGEYFRGGGYSSNFLTKGGMPVTMVRVNLIKGLGPVLQIAEGYSVELPEEVHTVLNNRTDKTWPTTWFAPIITGEGSFKDVYSVMENWGANHGSLSFGHIGAELIALAAILRIPVSVHNVSEDKIFRPSVWSAFGTKDIEGSDYRACQNFGPLYGRK